MWKATFGFIILLLVIGSRITPAPAQKNKGPNQLYPILFNYARNLYDEYDRIPPERRFILEEIANYILGALQFEGRADILLVGTSNATRTVMAEAWANAAAHYYGIEKVHIHSGGIQADRIRTPAILALEKAGFIIYKNRDAGSVTYEVKYSYRIPPVIIRSKKYNNKENPDFKFGAVVVCPNADINLPQIKGNNFRTSLHYFDPVAYDNTPDESGQYLERSREIAIEMFYLFYRLKNARQ